MIVEVRHFSPAETAQRLGVTVKALRVYERRGLVSPLRTSAGWRVYGPEQFQRLHQILALKGLGLSLTRIAELLKTPMALDGLLALQEEALASHRRHLDGALKRVRAARTKLRAGDVLTLDDLTTLAKETTMSDHDTMKTIFDPLVKKHFSDEELSALKARPQDWDQTEITAKWEALISECKILMQTGDAGSPAAMDLADRWSAQMKSFTQGDPKLLAKAGAVWGEAMKHPTSGPSLPLTPDMFAFIGRATAARNAKS